MRYFLILIVFITGCGESLPKYIDAQGHRGARGLYPENTTQGMIIALNNGVSTLEMDVVISKDSIVVVSHEPWFGYEISTHPDGTEITRENQMQFNIFQMTYDEIKRFDVGMKVHPRFPNQEKETEIKPRLTDLISTVELVARQKYKQPAYNIEIKSDPRGDNVFHPDVSTFCDLVIAAVTKAEVRERTTIQSFDIRPLKYLHETYPKVRLVYLIENKDGPQANLAKLGFTPTVYSPSHDLVDEKLVTYCNSKGMKLIPWTVNKTTDMERLIRLGVDGLITDYPDRLNALLKRLKIRAIKI